jgi:hypothetical protein
MATPAQTLQALQLFAQAKQRLQSADLAGALPSFARAHALLPSHPDIVAEYAGASEQAQDWPRAEKLLRQLAALRPQLRLECRIAQALFHSGRIEEAVSCVRRHLQQVPDDNAALAMLALMLTKDCRWEEALEAGNLLEARQPSATSLDVILNALFHLGRGGELDAVVETALQRCPDDLLAISVCAQHLIKRGDGLRGFAWPHAVRMRYKQGQRSASVAPANWWDGRPFDGLLLVSGKQGVGDEIIAASMFPDLQQFRRESGQEILVECDARLLPLFRRSFPALAFVGRIDEFTPPEATAGRDCRLIKALDLAHYFRRQTPIPPQAPWLVPDAAKVAQLRDGYRRQFRAQRLAGISWKSARAPQGASKSMTLTDMGPLLALPHHAWFNLQYGDIAADLAEAAAAGLPQPLIDARIDATADIDGLLAQIAALDVVVSTSSTTAHLAGAVGATCHLLLPKSRAVFWYWGYEGEHTPWYPSVTIHRNAREDDWRELAARVARALSGAA